MLPRPLNHYCAAIALGAGLLLAPAVHAAETAPDKDHGWYFSGKGGPSMGMISGVSPSQSGATTTEDSANNMIGAFGMATGYEFSYRYRLPLRLEMEFINRTEITYDASPLMTSRATGALASTVQNVTTMAKGYWHFPVGSRAWWPFVSAGLGWARTTAKSSYTAAGESPVKTRAVTDSLAWTAGVGATFKLGPQVMNDIELRYVDMGSIDWGLDPARNVAAEDFGSLTATELMFSLRYMF
jgi:opacity protein-like surface antigen